MYDEHGNTLGFFSKQFGASLLRSTWNLQTPGMTAVGKERRPVIAILRRIWNLIPYIGDLWVPFVFHFDFVDDVSGQRRARQRAAEGDPRPVHGDRPRPAAGLPGRGRMAVALDALQSR